MRAEQPAVIDLVVYGLAVRDLLHSTAGTITRYGGIFYAASAARKLGLRTGVVGTAATSELADFGREFEQRDIQYALSGFDGPPVVFEIRDADEVVEQKTIRHGGWPDKNSWPTRVDVGFSGTWVLGYPVNIASTESFLKEQELSGARIAIDLQHDVETLDHLAGLMSVCDIVFTNREAICHLFGVESLDEAAANFHEQNKATLVVKLGMAGCSVAPRGQPLSHFPAYAADFQYTVGAGDTFDAAFLWAVIRGASYEAAAAAGAKAAAAAIESIAADPSAMITERTIQARRTMLGNDPSLPRPEIYVAGHFHSEPLRAYILRLATALHRIGFVTFTPHIDGGVVGVSGVTPKSAFQADRAALDRCAGLVALLDGAYRGGTYFEIGYVVAKGGPVAVWVTDSTMGVSNMVSQSSDFVGGDIRKLLTVILSRCGTVAN